jgi:uncharacterized membrane protein HdeD (DUF308 family)
MPRPPVGPLPRNDQRPTAWLWLFLSLAGAATAAAPFVVDIDINKGGGAMVMGGLLFALLGFIVAIAYFGRASTLDRILSGKDLLARWTYRPDEWARYAGAEHLRIKSEKKGLFIMVAVISLVVGVGFLLYNPKGGAAVFAVLLGVVALCGLAAVLTTSSARRRNESRVGEAFISPAGVYLNEVLHAWSSMGARLEAVTYEEGAPPFVDFSYSFPRKGGRSQASVRVPVPGGREPEAHGLVAHFQSGLGRGR